MICGFQTITKNISLRQNLWMNVNIFTSTTFYLTNYYNMKLIFLINLQ